MSALGIRRGAIEGVTLSVHTYETWCYERHVKVEAVDLHYFGPIAALRAAGCLTPGMEQRRVGHRGGRVQCDERGIRFGLHRAPLKSAPDRWQLIFRWLAPELSVEFPGVRETCPSGPTSGRVCAEAARTPSRPILRLVIDNTRVH